MTKTELLKAVTTVQAALYELCALDIGDVERLRELRTGLEDAKKEIKASEIFAD